MRHSALRALAAALVVLSSPASAGECSALDDLAWLLGDWVADGEKSSFRETWSARGRETWEGSGIRTSKAMPANASREALRLVAMQDGIFYIAKVGHNPLPVAFRLDECEDGRFTFVNPAHDFPKRIEYLRKGDDGLVVRVGDGAGEGFALDFVRASAQDATPDAVLAAEDSRFAAMIAADAEAMRRWLAEDLAYVHSTGRVEGREQLIEALSSGRLRYLAIEPSERRVTMPGPDTAVVQGLARIRARSGDQAVDFPARYIAVYARADGTWRMTAWQSLRLP